MSLTSDFLSQCPLTCPLLEESKAHTDFLGRAGKIPARGRKFTELCIHTCIHTYSIQHIHRCTCIHTGTHTHTHTQKAGLSHPVFNPCAPMERWKVATASPHSHGASWAAVSRSEQESLPLTGKGNTSYLRLSSDLQVCT